MEKIDNEEKNGLTFR